MGSWSIRRTRSPPFGEIAPCPTSCSAAITVRLRSGAQNNRSSAPGRAALICYRSERAPLRRPSASVGSHRLVTCEKPAGRFSATD